MGAHQLPRRALSAALLAGAIVLAHPAEPKMSFIPIPEIITDPDEGNTIGFLAVFLFLDGRDEIQYMFAPDVRWNPTKGVFPTLRLFAYPTPRRRYSIAVGKSTTRDENYEFEFSDRSFWEGRAFVLANVLYERDSTERFYGFGNDSPEDGESNYTGANFDGNVTPGVWLLPAVNLSYTMGIRRFEVQTGQVDAVPFIIAEHPEVRGRGDQPGVYWRHRVAFTYDSRDSMDIPTRGAFATAYTEVADRRLGSSTSFVKFGFQWRDFIPLRRGNPILALRAGADYTSGSADTPFWEQSRLGGRRSLRGFGGDRFIDFNRSLAGAELRTRVYQRRLFGVNAEIELAPFVETGQVFRRVTESPVDDLHWSYGIGFRGVVRPQIVGIVDVGAGSEGFSIFTGVDYPF
jgi:outer membrane protein assembly factor BamA